MTFTMSKSMVAMIESKQGTIDLEGIKNIFRLENGRMEIKGTKEEVQEALNKILVH